MEARSATPIESKPEAPPLGVDLYTQATSGANTLSAGLAAHGFAVVDLLAGRVKSDSELVQEAEGRLCALGTLIRVFSQSGSLWREIGVDVDRPNNRSRGVGHLPLHLDFVNAAQPPDIICLLCIRPDPLKGGISIVASTVELSSQIEADKEATLRKAEFRDGKVEGLLSVGEDINPFAVFDCESAIACRYTGHLLDRPLDDAQHSALTALAEELDRRTIRIDLRRGQLLVVDQRTTLHGRLPLGPGQDSLPLDGRRMMLLSFVRAFL